MSDYLAYASPSSRRRLALETIHQGEERRPIVVLIHGTWARRAGWTRTEAELPIALIERGFTVLRLKWSGRNRHRDRYTAGLFLRQQLLTMRSEGDTRPIHLVGHSHGGNVAVYALNSSDQKLEDITVATLATPFVGAERVSWPRWASIMAGIMQVYSLIMFLAVVGSGLGMSAVDRRFILFTPAIVAFGMLSIDRIIGFPSRNRRPEPQDLIAQAPQGDRLVTVAALSDEAAGVLAISALAARMIRRLVGFARLRNLFGVLVVIIGIAAAGRALSIGLPSGINWSYIAAAAIVGAPFFLPTFAICVFFLAHLIVGSDGLRYGAGWMFTVDSAPIGASAAIRLRSPTSTGKLVHSIHGWPAAVASVCEHLDRLHPTRAINDRRGDP